MCLNNKQPIPKDLKSGIGYKCLIIRYNSGELTTPYSRSKKQIVFDKWMIERSYRSSYDINHSWKDDFGEFGWCLFIDLNEAIEWASVHGYPLNLIFEVEYKGGRFIGSINTNNLLSITCNQIKINSERVMEVKGKIYA